MKKVIRLTESDLVRLVKRVLSEEDKNNFYKRRIIKYEELINYKMTEIFIPYCKGSNKTKRKKEFTDRIKDFIYEHIERFDISNTGFNPWIEDYSEATKEFEKIFNSFFLERIEQFLDENCKKYNSLSDISLSNLKKMMDRPETKKLIEDGLEDSLSILYPDGFSSFKKYEESVVVLTYRRVEDGFNLKGKNTSREFLSDYIIREYGDVIKNCFDTKECFKRRS